MSHLPRPRAITLDLDDTLWPVMPAILRAEAEVDAFLRERCPRTAEAFPPDAMRRLREQVAREYPHLDHDYTEQRRITLRRAIAHCGEDLAEVEPAFEVFYAARNRVEFYPDVPEALARIAARVPVAGLTNGNADLARVGIAHHFRFNLGAREHGAAKPDPSIFLAACRRLGCAPGEVLHVGDDPMMDVTGARRAGVRSCWINRGAHPWPHDPHRPELEFDSLAGLADWLDAAPDAPE